jgi:hypothetical protein
MVAGMDDLPSAAGPGSRPEEADAWRLVAGLSRLLTAMAEDQIALSQPGPATSPDPAGEHLAQVIDLVHPSRRQSSPRQ